MSVFIILSVMIAEAYGSIFLYLVLLVMIGIFAAWPRLLLKTAISRGVWYLWLVPGFATASSIWSSVPLDTLRAGLQLGLTTLMGLLLAWLVRPKDFIYALATASTIIVILSLLKNNYVIDGMTSTVNWSGLFANKNTMCYTGAYLALCCVALAISPKSPPAARGMAALGVVLAYIICFRARSVATILAMTIAMGLIVFAHSASSVSRTARAHYVEIASIVLLILGTLATIVVLRYSNELLALVNKDPTLTGRTVLWFWAGRVIPDAVWLGHGYAGFWVQGRPMAEFLWHLLHIASRMGFHFHNLFIETWVELGVTGLSLTVFTIVVTVVRSYRRLRAAPDAVTGFGLALVVMALITQTQDVQLFGVFNPMFLIFVALAAYAHPRPKLVVPARDRILSW
ncbi:O-antigen ligase family protein [Methylobacterium currus]|uniref:O-antigen ligase family protein n=1 Tax=Methylobacterium currus TaxID=2051553 RepID=UPI0013DFB00E|nr:O-antigen ligase family protein [Methylobacterium currus]